MSLLFLENYDSIGKKIEIRNPPSWGVKVLGMYSFLNPIKISTSDPFHFYKGRGDCSGKYA